VYSTDEELVTMIPLGRKVRFRIFFDCASLTSCQGITRDMAGVCIYFASAAGSWTTGATLQVDGGQIVCGPKAKL
jgi:NAD(P)-dependent dehydrogenase (short-subunit alcohol dehydrogenase family)